MMGRLFGLALAVLLWPAAVAAMHDFGGRAPFNPDRACLTPEAVTQIIGLSSAGNEAVAELWDRKRFAGECKYFAHGLSFWPEEVFAVMQWGPAHRSEAMLVVRGHEAHGLTVYTWVTGVQARSFGVQLVSGG